MSGSGAGATALDAVTLDADERRLVDLIAERREELVALACRLIAFATTSRSGRGIRRARRPRCSGDKEELDTGAKAGVTS